MIIILYLSILVNLKDLKINVLKKNKVGTKYITIEKYENKTTERFNGLTNQAYSKQ